MFTSHQSSSTVRTAFRHYFVADAYVLISNFRATLLDFMARYHARRSLPLILSVLNNRISYCYCSVINTGVYVGPKSRNCFT